MNGGLFHSVELRSSNFIIDMKTCAWVAKDYHDFIKCIEIISLYGRAEQIKRVVKEKKITRKLSYPRFDIPYIHTYIHTTFDKSHLNF